MSRQSLPLVRGAGLGSKDLMVQSTRECLGTGVKEGPSVKSQDYLLVTPPAKTLWRLCSTVFYAFFMSRPPCWKVSRASQVERCSLRNVQPCFTAYGGTDPRPHARSRHVDSEHRPFFGPSLGVCPSNQDQRVGTFLLRAVPTWLAQIPRSPEKAVWLYTDSALDL